MSDRELIVLGTASQAPTRYRNHNGYVLRFDEHVVLFDPGEGTQRQLILAGVSAASIGHICITHFHGDHCLGLPGVLQRISLDGAPRRVALHYPASGHVYLDRLRNASIWDQRIGIDEFPVTGAGSTGTIGHLTLRAARLDHRVDAYGWRLEEPAGRRMLPDRLAAAGIHGPDVGRLQREGAIHVHDRRVTLDEMSEHRSGQSFAFVMDTRWCDAALELAARTDLFVCESTFLDRDRALAHDYGHLTAVEAGRIAQHAGARRLVLTHFSQRYVDDHAFLEEARRHHDDVHVARDLDCVPMPARN
jgi:ribonuclease Z